MPAATSSRTGALGEQAFKTYFLERGIFVAEPLYDLHKTDLIAEWDDRLVKINVKTFSPYRNKYNVRLTCGGHNLRRSYQSTEIDFFGLVCLEHDAFWMVPIHDVAGRTSITWIPDHLRQYKKLSTFDLQPYRIK